VITSLQIHLSNHRPQSHKGLKSNLSSRCNHQRKKWKCLSKKKPEPKNTDEENDATADKEVKDFFANWREKRK
jgi:hypothetical protein